MIHPEERCPGDVYRGKNICECPSCQECNDAKRPFINASEDLHWLFNRGINTPDNVERAEARKAQAGDRWEFLQCIV